MKKRGYATFFQIVICAFVVLQSNGPFCTASAEQFPPAKFTLPAPDSESAQKYLGLKAIEPFRVNDIGAKLVVVEFMSALCPHCQANAPVMNNIYKSIQGDSSLADVKVLALAIDNKKAEVEAYKKKYKTAFPILIDEGMAISVSMGGIPTPTTMIIATEDGKVLYSHAGVIQDPDRFIKRLKTFHKKQ